MYGLINIFGDDFMACDLIPRLNSLSTEFGITRELNEERDLRCVDICVPHVLLIHAFDPFEKFIPWPNATTNPNRDCRGVFDIPPGLPPENCFFRVTCANEEFNCVEGVPTITVTVEGQLVLEFVVNGTSIFWVKEITVLDETLNAASNWYRTDTGNEIVDTGFAFFMTLIDGSCIVIDSQCEIDTEGQQVIFTANVVDKLWKHENVWVEGVTPYLQLRFNQPPTATNITVHEEFVDHAIPSCIIP
ncbi:MAG TPA: hypothetical protein PK422_00040 [Sedimentibacter sp.]|jgi:hypothetical protein|nr:hypothetical protein [Sedimentibacter sp.]HQC69276.1 hypothetical protein [Sedimentibacter sp.]HQK54569.1 hypothetical protein [Sedimentibacter sp.]